MVHWWGYFGPIFASDKSFQDTNCSTMNIACEKCYSGVVSLGVFLKLFDEPVSFTLYSTVRKQKKSDNSLKYNTLCDFAVQWSFC